MIRNLLDSNGIPINLDETGAPASLQNLPVVLDVESSALQNFDPQLLAQNNQSLSFSVAWDEALGADRIFVSTSDFQNTPAGDMALNMTMPSPMLATVPIPAPAPGTAPTSAPRPPQTMPILPGSAGCNTVREYFSVLDFILALEHICRDHTEHPQVYTSDSHLSEADGHFLTMSTQVMGYAPSSTTAPEPGASWQIPFDEIGKLITFSERLDLDEEITPVQAWQTLRLITGGEVDALVMREVQVRLCKVVRCSGSVYIWILCPMCMW